MAAELVLKLIKRAPENYFDLQEERENHPVTLADLHGREINGITFRMGSQ
jgi:hypothetical protein